MTPELELKKGGHAIHRFVKGPNMYVRYGPSPSPCRTKKGFTLVWFDKNDCFHEQWFDEGDLLPIQPRPEFREP